MAGSATDYRDFGILLWKSEQPVAKITGIKKTGVLPPVLKFKKVKKLKTPYVFS